jgi:ubiquinone/menaquinone biosynthesis C-methylase UbiE
MESVGDPYRKRAGLYEAVVDRLNRALHELAFRAHPVGPGEQVLDVGCGTGAQLAHYAAAGCDVSGVDLSKAMLDRARARLGPDADLRHADAADLPYEDGRFDLVLSSMFLHELSESVRGRVLVECARVLGTDGTLVVVDFGVGALSLRGRLRRVVSTGFELAAGLAHFRAFRSYVDGGGLPDALGAAPFVIESERRLGGGDLALLVARPSAS